MPMLVKEICQTALELQRDVLYLQFYDRSRQPCEETIKANTKNDEEADALKQLAEFNICSQAEIDDLSNQTAYEMGIALKELLSVKLQDLYRSNKKQFEKLSLWIIKDWGGITSGNDKEAMRLVDNLLNNKASFERIASASKVGAFMHPEKYIIYDSRVAYSLNWILLAENTGEKFFPMPDGRNSKLNAFDIDVLIRQSHISHYSASDEEFAKRLFISNKDKTLYIDKAEAYSELNTLIKKVNKALWAGDSEKANKLYYTEMLLFAIADNVIFHDIVNRLELKIKTR